MLFVRSFCLARIYMSFTKYKKYLLWTQTYDRYLFLCVIVDIENYLQQICSHSFVLRFPSRQVGSAHFLPLLLAQLM